MLSVTEYNYIKLLYEKFQKMSEYINELMKKNEWESLKFAIQDKEALLKQITQFEKIHLEKIKQNKELLNIRLDLINSEKKNIELLKTLKEETKKELSSVVKTRKILNAYEPSLANGSSTINIEDA